MGFGKKKGGNDIINLRQLLFAIRIFGNDEMLKMETILAQVNFRLNQLVNIIWRRPLIITIIQHQWEHGRQH
ncbi:MAG: hypothetical protein DYG89_35720 [Caldilinea sp. CFX5]|nr:hypothetical protein [Caldilinea sp. CFX5]